ncbi:DUF262 domain-containing protein [Acinetobacter johnsonii]|uniref:DUF262 domain-containing protein n=1 Tax=Acinetobacter johnsonii TaxID=40214 RepID=A0AA42U0X3_ACIJO|nr:DUF262 domain-containing protein [Acinetobacter johnsonii]MDH1437619.1 DUF262 domain-containing protein [Acinetobacter johnsonii]
MSSQYTFWRLVEEFKIIVPIIQRDYAQGRKDDLKIAQIRKTFIQHLLEKINQNSHKSDLDFVYGSVVDEQLKLLDGQQRLTTLFLLHWYLGWKSEVILDKTIQDKLLRFSYETRTSSRDFIKSLIEQAPNLKCIRNHDHAKKLSERIENEAWYFSIWKKDPTVQSILEMLDEIDLQFHAKEQNSHSYNAAEMWDNLVTHQVLTFYFLRMDDFALTDELYIKMNARGVQLTEFENFKAWLQGYTEDEIDAQDRKDFFSKLDREWTDFLWNLKCKFEDSKEKNEAFDFDSMFMQVFKSVLLCHFYRNEDIDHKNKQQSEQSSDPTHETDEKSLLSRLRKNLFVSSEEYKRILQGTDGRLKEILKNVSRLFDFLINHKEDLEIETILRQVFKSGKSSYLDQAHFAILYFYVQHIDQSEQFSDWFNISVRLVNNAKGYYNAESNLIKVLQGLNSLAASIGKGKVLEKLAALQKDSQEFKTFEIAFDDHHLVHEIEKSKLILEDEKWKSLFKPYEQHDYFYGQIDFLIKFSRHEDSQKVCPETFKNYADKAFRLFSKEFLDDDQYRLQRSLLSFDNYLAKDGANRTFCREVYRTVRHRNENWRKVFDSANKRKILQRLLDELPADFNVDSLDDIIETYGFQVDDWRIYFIKHPEAIGYCQKYQIRLINHDEIYLLSSRQMNGAHAELRSYALYLELQQQGIDNKINDANVILDYEYVANSIDKPAVLLKNWNNGTLKIKFSQDQFLAEFYCRDQHGNEQLLELNQDIDPFSFFNNVQNEIVNWVKVKNAVEGAA